MYTYIDVINKHEFSTINNGEVAPEICNEFITIYIENKKDCEIDKNDAIDYTRNLCHWLFLNGHTCSKLSMIN